MVCMGEVMYTVCQLTGGDEVWLLVTLLSTAPIFIYVPIIGITFSIFASSLVYLPSSMSPPRFLHVRTPMLQAAVSNDDGICNGANSNIWKWAPPRTSPAIVIITM